MAEWGVTLHRDEVTFWGDGNVLEVDRGGECARCR